MSDPSIRVLIIEDDDDTRANLCDIVELFGLSPLAVGTAAAALACPELPSVGLILLDRKLPDTMADHLLPKLREANPHAGVIIATAYADLNGTIAALRHGVDDYLLKPINPDLLRLAIDRIQRRHQLERDKARSETMFRELVESAGSLILILRPDHRVAYVNPVGQKLAHANLETVIGCDCFDLFMSHDPSARSRYSRVFERVAAGREISDFEISVVCAEGRRRWLLCNARRLDDYDGQPAILVVGQDLTARRDAEQRLLQSERLAAIGKAMAGLAHESRNALQRSQAALDLLASELEGNEFATKLINRIRTAQDDLHRLYEDVREYARPIRVTPQPACIELLLRTAWDELVVKREDRNTRLNVAVHAGDTNCDVEPFLIRQVFRNLIDNSLASCEDPVVITVEFRDAAVDDSAALEIAICDNGPGVSRADRDRVFEEFFTTRTHGTGLGLSIVQRLIDAHHGHICMDPAADSGFGVLIRLPRRQSESSAVQ